MGYKSTSPGRSCLDQRPQTVQRPTSIISFISIREQSYRYIYQPYRVLNYHQLRVSLKSSRWPHDVLSTTLSPPSPSPQDHIRCVLRTAGTGIPANRHAKAWKFVYRNASKAAATSPAVAVSNTASTPFADHALGINTFSQKHKTASQR